MVQRLCLEQPAVGTGSPTGELCGLGLQNTDLDEQSGEIVDAALAHDLAVLQLVEEDGRHDEPLSCRRQPQELADVRAFE